MPNNKQWNSSYDWGNPKKSEEINEAISAVKKAETRGKGR